MCTTSSMVAQCRQHILRGAAQPTQRRGKKWTEWRGSAARPVCVVRRAVERTQRCAPSRMALCAQEGQQFHKPSCCQNTSARAAATSTLSANLMVTTTMCTTSSMVAQCRQHILRGAAQPTQRRGKKWTEWRGSAARPVCVVRRAVERTQRCAPSRMAPCVLPSTWRWSEVRSPAIQCAF